MILAALKTLLPPGSIFHKTGKNITALLKAIAWQFETLQSYFIYQSRQTNPFTSDFLDTLAKEYNIAINQLTEPQARQLLNFIKHNPLDMTKAKFFAAFKYLFPRVDIIASPSSVLSYQNGQCGVFEVGASQVNGFIHQAIGGDTIYIQGTVDSFQQLRFLKWFMERFDRAKHKHVFAIITEETSATASAGCAQVGAIEVGAFSNGPI